MRTNENGYFFEPDENGYGLCMVLAGPWRDEYAEIITSRNVAVLRLSTAAGWCDHDVSFVTPLRTLTGVEVFDWETKDISGVFANTQLKYLALQCKFVGPVSFSSLRQLEVCKIFWRPATEGLFDCDQLKHLNVVDYPARNLDPLAKLSRLRRLQLSSRKLQSLRGVEPLGVLSVLDLANCPALTDVASLSAAVSLETIELEKCRKIGRLPSLSLPTLRDLIIVDCGRIESLRPLDGCLNLQRVRITGDTTVVDGDFSQFCKLARLREIWYAEKPHYHPRRDELVAMLGARSSGRWH